jgi:aminopeptidase N
MTLRRNKVFLLLPVLTLLLNVAALGQKQIYSADDSLRGRITPQRSWWDVGYYRLTVSVDPGKKWLNGSVLIVYKVLGDGNTLQVDLQPPLKIDKITSNRGELSFTKQGKNAHFVAVNNRYSTGAIDSVEVFYSGHPIIARNPPWLGGFQFTKDKNGGDFLATSCQGLGASAWWPNKDHSYDEPDSMLIRVTVPWPLMDVSNGRLLREVDNADSTTTYDWFVSNPINNYGVNINAASYAHFDFYVLPYNLEKAKEQFKQAKLMLRAFEHWFGPYPFYEDGYKLVEVPYLGMEHQSSVTYGNRYQNGYLGNDLSGTGWGLKWDFIIIHESGHEWFANNITYQDIADMWIHESFTNYSETLFTEYYYGKEAGTDYNVGTRKSIKNDIPIIGVYGVNQRGSGDMYPKGGNMIHTIRHAINDDERFRKVLRGLNEHFRHKTVTTKEVEEFISKESGLNLSKVFDQYLRTVNIPKLEYRMEKQRLYFRWVNVVPGFDLPLPINSNSSSVKVLKPTTKWKKLKLKNGEQLVDSAYLERMYYISVEDVSNR